MTRSPLVSCLIPTADRPRFVPLALKYFFRQSYPNRELIIVDDGAERVDHLVPFIPQVRYCRLRGRYSVGEKLNVACEVSRGEIVAHWDDDDWIAPRRLAVQVDAISSRGAGGSGLSALRYFDPLRRTAWLWQNERVGWLAGGSLCYRKEIWSATPFRRLESGEDVAFVLDVGPDRFVDLGDADFYLGVIHGGNTSSRPQSSRDWKPLEYSKILDLLGDDARLYEQFGHQVAFGGQA